MIKRMKERFWDRKHREKLEEQRVISENAEALAASEIIGRTDDLLVYLKKQFPNQIPDTEISQWTLGTKKGEQDVIKLIEYLLMAANK